jgi:hypothetical protein
LQAERFTEPKPAAEGDRHERIERVLTAGVEQRPCLVGIEGPDLAACRPRRVDTSSFLSVVSFDPRQRFRVGELPNRVPTHRIDDVVFGDVSQAPLVVQRLDCCKAEVDVVMPVRN